jgi:hypothetical protein
LFVPFFGKQFQIKFSLRFGSRRIDCLEITPHHPQNLIAFSPHQTAIAPHHQKPDRLSPQINQRSHPHKHKPDRLFHQNQTAIAASINKPTIATHLKSNGDHNNSVNYGENC